MGLLGKLFGKEKELPPLEPSSPAAAKLNEHKSALEPFVHKIHDRMEFVPAANTVYVYIGKPPGMFGLAWFENGQEINFKTFTTSKGLKQKQIQVIYGKLGEAYAASESAERYETVIGGKKVIVLPSDDLARKIEEVIHTVAD
ncbi:MAG: hypothetical protein EHM54_00580 [Nitrospiraceae bacterium]|nr:MAG: hypothetical protein EHM54_00580 [Nitrospiraceae bacterium]